MSDTTVAVAPLVEPVIVSPTVKPVVEATYIVIEFVIAGRSVNSPSAKPSTYKYLP
jgi:hypothetical protein